MKLLCCSFYTYQLSKDYSQGLAIANLLVSLMPRATAAILMNPKQGSVHPTSEAAAFLEQRGETEWSKIGMNGNP